MADVAPGDIVPIADGALVGEPRRVPLPVLDQAYYTAMTTTVVRTRRCRPRRAGRLLHGRRQLAREGPAASASLTTDLDVVERLRSWPSDSSASRPNVTPREGYHEVDLPVGPLARGGRLRIRQAAARRGSHPARAGLRISRGNLARRTTCGLRRVPARPLRGRRNGHEGVPRLDSASASFAEEIRTMLLALGLASTTREDDVSGLGRSRATRSRCGTLDHARDFDEWSASSAAARTHCCPSWSPLKAETVTVIYLPRRCYGDKLVPVGHRPRNGACVNARSGAGHSPRTGARRSSPRPLTPELAHALGYLYEPVAENADGGEQLPTTSRFPTTSPTSRPVSSATTPSA